MPRSEITWLERPYDMNGSVRPVVGISPSETAMCMNAVSPIVAVRPTARYWPKGSAAVRAIRNPSQQNSANRKTTTQHADESPFLADGAEQEIGVGVRQIAELLLSLAEAGAEQPARADADERLVDLEAAFGRRVARIEEGEHPGQAVLRVPDLVKDQDHRHAAEQDEVADLGARGEQHEPAEQRHQRGHREVGLEQDRAATRGRGRR